MIEVLEDMQKAYALPVLYLSFLMNYEKTKKMNYKSWNIVC